MLNCLAPRFECVEDLVRQRNRILGFEVVSVLEVVEVGLVIDLGIILGKFAAEIVDTLKGSFPVPDR